MRVIAPWGRRGRFLHLPDDSVIALSSEGVRLYRLVKHDPPEGDDFQEQRRSRAEKTGMSELSRTGLSHFAELEQAAAVKWKDEQRIALVTIPSNRRIHVARTERDFPGHYDVWIPGDLIEEILETAEIVD